MVYGFIRGLGDFKHNLPVRTGLGVRRRWLLAIGQLLGGELDIFFRLVAGGVVGENSGTVEGTVVFDKVQLLYKVSEDPMMGTRETSPNTCHQYARVVVHGHQFQ